MMENLYIGMSSQKTMSRWFVVHEKKFQKQNHKLKSKQQLRLRAYVPRLQQRAPCRTYTLAFTHRMCKLSEEFPPLQLFCSRRISGNLEFKCSALFIQKKRQHIDTRGVERHAAKKGEMNTARKKEINSKLKPCIHPQQRSTHIPKTSCGIHDKTAIL